MNQVLPSVDVQYVNFPCDQGEAGPLTIYNIKNSLESNPGPMFSKQKCDVETALTLGMDFAVKETCSSKPLFLLVDKWATRKTQNLIIIHLKKKKLFDVK